MKYSQSLVAKQYAKAYLAEYESQLNLADIEHIKLVLKFFRKHHNFMSLVSELIDDAGSDHILIQELFDHFSLPVTLKKLVDVLIRHKRLIFFAQVLQDIGCLYLLQHNILEVTVSSAAPLEALELEQFEKFFTELSGKRIISNVVLDESLIAGVRMQSDLFLWEYSIASRLRTLRQNLLIEG